MAIFEALEQTHAAHIERAGHGFFLKCHFKRSATSASTPSTNSTHISSIGSSPQLSPLASPSKHAPIQHSCNSAYSRAALLRARQPAPRKIQVKNTFIHMDSSSDDSCMEPQHHAHSDSECLGGHSNLHHHSDPVPEQAPGNPPGLFDVYERGVDCGSQTEFAETTHPCNNCTEKPNVDDAIVQTDQVDLILEHSGEKVDGATQWLATDVAEHSKALFDAVRILDENLGYAQEPMNKESLRKKATHLLQQGMTNEDIKLICSRHNKHLDHIRPGDILVKRCGAHWSMSGGGCIWQSKGDRILVCEIGTDFLVSVKCPENGRFGEIEMVNHLFDIEGS